MSTIYTFHAEPGAMTGNIAQDDAMLIYDTSGTITRRTTHRKVRHGGFGTPVSYATAGNQTYTAADLLAGIIVRDCAGAGRSDVLPTAALLVAALANPAVGDVIQCYIINGSDAAETLTIGAGTGGGFDTNQTSASRVIAQNASKLLHIRLTNVTASSEAYVAYL